MKKIKNNKGFTLVELVVAIAVLAIIITPILQSFVTSAKMNLKARKTMIATDITQSIMEGFADKTYTEILYIVDHNLGSGMVGDKIFSTIDDNKFNDNNAYVSSSTIFGEVDTKDPHNFRPDEISWGVNMNKKTVDIYNKESATYMCYNEMFNTVKGYWASACNNYLALIGDKTQKISYWKDHNDMVLFICYANIESGGFYYDAIVSFVPGAETKDDIYYPYYVEIRLYEYDKATGNHNFDDSVMTYTSGIKNVYKKGSKDK